MATRRRKTAKVSGSRVVTSIGKLLENLRPLGYLCTLPKWWCNRWTLWIKDWIFFSLFPPGFPSQWAADQKVSHVQHLHGRPLSPEPDEPRAAHLLKHLRPGAQGKLEVVLSAAPRDKSFQRRLTPGNKMQTLQCNG